MSEQTKRDDKYIQFPLCLLRQTYSNPETAFDLIVNFGIVHYAMSFEYNMVDVGRQLMYAYYRNKEMIQSSLYKTINKYALDGLLTTDEDYNGFSGSEFDPLAVSVELLGLFQSDSEFKEAAILRYQIQQAISGKFLCVELGDINSTIRNYNEGLEYKKKFEQQFGSDCMPGVKVKQLFECRDSGKDLDLFRAYIGIKSMIGNRNFISSNKPAILSRMIGCKSKAAFEYDTCYKPGKDKSNLPTVAKYSKKYQMDKLLLTLVEQKFIMFLSKPKVSVIYLSKYMEPEELGKLITDTKDKQNLKQRMKDAAASL